MDYGARVNVAKGISHGHALVIDHDMDMHGGGGFTPSALAKNDLKLDEPKIILYVLFDLIGMSSTEEYDFLNTRDGQEFKGVLYYWQIHQREQTTRPVQCYWHEPFIE